MAFLDLLPVGLIGVLFLLILFFGYWLKRAGKPYPGLQFNFHKLLALGTAVYLTVTINRFSRAGSLDGWHIGFISITFFLIVVMILTGGLLSIEKPMPAMIPVVHKWAPYLSLLSTAAAFYLWCMQ